MRSFTLFLAIVISLATMNTTAATETLGKTGKIKVLRVNDVGINYGPPSDRIAAEVIVLFENDKNAYGFQLRKDANEVARKGMLDLLRDAYINNLTVKLTYRIESGSTKGKIIVVQLTR